MSSEIIKKHLDELGADSKYDTDFVGILRQCNENDEDGETAAEKMIAVIAKRYVENKKDTTKRV